MSPIKAKSSLPVGGYAARASSPGQGGKRRLWLNVLSISLPLFLVILVAFSPTVRVVLGGTFRPWLAGARQAGNWLSGGVRGIMPLSAMERRMLAEMQERVAQLQIELAEAEQALDENRELREELGLPPPTGWQRLPALIIARDPASWDRRFRIDRGTVDGVEVGALVMAGEQTVGRIVETAARSSMVATLADPGCRLAVRLRGEGGTGVLRGGFRGGSDRDWNSVIVDFMPRDGDYKVGELVETSGLGGFGPAGIPVARVVAWKEGRVAEIVDSAFARLRVRPLVEDRSFRTVAVLLRMN